MAEEKIEEFKEIFLSIPRNEQFSLFSSLLLSSDDYLKWRLKSLINTFDTPDFVTMLPPEIQMQIFSYIDGCSLLAACQVSKKWNELLKVFDIVWKKKCLEIGVCVKDKPSSYPWIKAFSKSMKQLHMIKEGSAFCEKFINLQNNNTLVKAVDYNDGYLCTVSNDDCISIWVLDLNVPILTFPVYHTVSCVKFKPGFVMVCGHFSGILTSWDLSEMNDLCYRVQNGTFIVPINYGSTFSLLLMKYKMHGGPVFSCDFDQELEVLISGGGDKNIKFWDIRSGALLHSINSDSQWVLKVVLLPNFTETGHTVIAMRREAVDKYHWPKQAHHCSLDSGEAQNASKNLNLIQLTVSVPLNESDDVFTIPGFQINNRCIGLIIQDLQEKYATLNLFDLESFKKHATIPLQFKARKFLAMGDRFALFLSVGKALYTSSLVVVDIMTGKTVGSQTIPHSKMTTPDGSQLAIGDTRWLDGLRGWEFFDDEFLLGKEENFSPNVKPSAYSEHEFKNDYSFDECLGRCITNDICRKQIPKSLNSERRFLILASGLKSENGKFFSLWWRRRFDIKTKME
ncbi:UNVERIFIED_CONTAM: hypothetical protein RMT77_015783 [Armadillidium vulgare]